jgi:hypothetical protein
LAREAAIWRSDGIGSFLFGFIVHPVGALVRIPMMSITQSDLMPISAERSDAGFSQCERVIGISQEFLLSAASILSGTVGLLQ